ncbi:pseudoazurin [Gammaproteobacteria bacterium]|jgi:pseudoazurin|nr:pseudoazurin [Gammaproteobacteria bacterium]MDA9661664.1 pseudoazurin [Pseudomonadota bacterium]MDA9130423.1 pseudoazurin [Gammaproteobacteria bacterium]MDA9249344.1 pseudoazurin [Gammaproteobacteria bacterium]MDA9332318.1 pseudoazurin [Gammaproteobacteria bacterium]|tara:strand:- start:24 stop:467 length:444 start_codon:yes stop_codon:yes gene_type:complete
MKFRTFLALSLSVFGVFTSAANHEVKMLNSGVEGFMVFEPAVVKAAVGDTVTFKATDMAHNSASIEGMIPEGANAWNGAMSQDVTVTVNKEGVYVYQCTPHSMMAMVGVIQVGGSLSNMDAIQAKVASVKAGFVTNKERLDTYLGSL